MASPKSTRNAHRTTPDPATITQIKGYPSKLIIYLCPASSYWQIRYFSGGTYHKKSSRTSVKQAAMEAAKQFNDDINYQQRVGPQNKQELFEAQAVEWFQLEKARCSRGQITQPFFNTLVKRFNKHVSPYFSGKLVKEITFVQLELFLAVLAREGLKADTQKGYLNIVFSVLKHAYENGLLAKLPKRPKLHIEDNPSDYFNADEMKLLIATAKCMAGESVRIEQGKANKHGTRPVLELAKGKHAVELADMPALISTLTLLKEAVLAGELDAPLEAASTALRAGFKKAQANKGAAQ